MKKIIVIQTSLNKKSKTAILANETIKILKKSKKVKVELIDLRKVKIPFCDGRDITKYPKDVVALEKKLHKADGFVLAFPVYNYSFSGVFKNFTDIFSVPMANKHAAIISNSGGIRSWNHGAGDVMKTLAMHDNITIVQPMVSSWSGCYEDGKLIDKDLIKLLEEMCKNLIKNLR